MKANGDAAALAFDGGDAQTLAHGFEDGVLQKVIHGGGRGPKRSSSSLRTSCLFLVGGNGGDALVGAEAQIFAGNVVFGDANVEAEAEGGAEFGGGLFALEFGDGALEHLAVEVEADGFDVAVLLAAEHVAGAAEFEVESGDAEAGAEFAEFFHGGEALAGDVGERGLGRDEQVGVGALRCAADAAAELIELGEAETIGAIDEDGVGARDVEAVFDDGGGDEDVGFVADEFEHDAFEFFFAHLAVADDDAGFRDELLDERGERVDGFDAVVDEVDLAVAGEFVFDGACGRALR